MGSYKQCLKTNGDYKYCLKLMGITSITYDILNGDYKNRDLNHVRQQNDVIFKLQHILLDWGMLSLASS